MIDWTKIEGGTPPTGKDENGNDIEVIACCREGSMLVGTAYISEDTKQWMCRDGLSIMPIHAFALKPELPQW